MEIREMAKKIHRCAIDKGWWEKDRNIPTILCLIHSEVSEALEAYREGQDDHIGEEFADIVIRVFDATEHLGIDIEKEIVDKYYTNMEREHRHGGKRC